MKNLILVLLVLTAGFLSANAQQKQTKPEEKSIVNKEYDEDGNLIKYDSTFVWSWSGDSAFQFDFPMNGFFSNDFEQLHKELQQRLGDMNFDKPRFESEEQEKAWEELMEKQQKEREELKKGMKQQ